MKTLAANLSTTSTSFLEQRADITYRVNNWNILTRVQNFQTVIEAIQRRPRPYKRLPQVTFNYNQPKENNQLNLDLIVKMSILRERGRCFIK